MKNLIYATTLLSVICMIALNANLPAFADSAGIPPHITGWIVSMNPLVCLFFSFPFAYLSDRTNRPLVMFIGLLFYLASAILLVCIKNIEALFVVKILEGLAIAAFLPASVAFITDISSKDKLAQSIGSYNAVFNLGFIVAPLFSAFISVLFDLNAIFIFVLVCCCLNIFICLLLFKKYRTSSLRAQKDVTCEENFKSSDLKTFTWPVIISVSFVSLSYGYACGVYDSVWAYYIIDIGGDVFLVNLTYFCYALPVFLLSKYMGKLADKYQNLALPIMLGSLVISMCIFSYGFLTIPVIICVLCGFEGAGNAAAYPAAYSAVVKSSDKFFKGRAIGIFNAARTGGNFFGVIIAGYLFTVAAYLPFVVNAFVILFAAISAAYCLKKFPLRDSLPEYQEDSL